MRLHSDQGGSFEGKVIRGLCKLWGVKKTRTTPYHPQGDGITERFNRTLIQMLRTLEPCQKADWKTHLASLVHAYNCTLHATTGFSPFFLLFGRHPRLPVDMLLGQEDQPGSQPKDLPQYVKEAKERIGKAYDEARTAMDEARQKQKRHYDESARGSTLQVGDCVLVCNVGLKGKQKLADKWKNDIYMVTEIPYPDMPVFKVQKEGSREEKVLHRNMLLPLTWPFKKPKSTASGQKQKHSNIKQPLPSIDVESSTEDEAAAVQVTVHTSRNTAGQNVSGTPDDADGMESCDGSDASALHSDVDIDLATSVTETEEETFDRTPPRRKYPTRERRPPDRYGDYVQYQQTVHPSWLARARFLLTLLDTREETKEIMDALLYVVISGK